MTEPSLPEKIVAVHDSLTGGGIPHAFGGALALAYYAEPRATIDIDLNVFVETSRYPVVRQALVPLGVGDDVDSDALERDGQCRLWWGRTPLDLFFAYDEIHDAMRRGSRLVPFGDDKLPVLGPEHLVVCKALFDRPKDWLDIEQMLVCTEHIDIAEIDTWLTRIVGDDDPRKQRFDHTADELLDG
jgi:hypothetical protein